MTGDAKDNSFQRCKPFLAENYNCRCDFQQWSDHCQNNPSHDMHSIWCEGQKWSESISGHLLGFSAHVIGRRKIFLSLSEQLQLKSPCNRTQIFYKWSKSFSKHIFRENCPNREFLLVRIFSYSIRIRENMDQKKLRIWILFTKWKVKQV